MGTEKLLPVEVHFRQDQHPFATVAGFHNLRRFQRLGLENYPLDLFEQCELVGQVVIGIIKHGSLGAFRREPPTPRAEPEIVAVHVLEPHFDVAPLVHARKT